MGLLWRLNENIKHLGVVWTYKTAHKLICCSSVNAVNRIDTLKSMWKCLCQCWGCALVAKGLAMQASEPKLGSPESTEMSRGCGGWPVIPALEGGDRGSPRPIPASWLAIPAMLVNSRFDWEILLQWIRWKNHGPLHACFHMCAYVCPYKCNTHTHAYHMHMKKVEKKKKAKFYLKILN